MERISHRLIMLKPMRAGADGYAGCKARAAARFCRFMRAAFPPPQCTLIGTRVGERRAPSERPA